MHNTSQWTVKSQNDLAKHQGHGSMSFMSPTIQSLLFQLKWKPQIITIKFVLQHARNLKLMKKI